MSPLLPPFEKKDIPEKKVGEVVRELINQGYTSIGCIKQNNGDWTISAK